MGPQRIRNDWATNVFILYQYHSLGISFVLYSFSAPSTFFPYHHTFLSPCFLKWPFPFLKATSIRPYCHQANFPLKHYFHLLAFHSFIDSFGLIIHLLSITDVPDFITYFYFHWDDVAHKDIHPLLNICSWSPLTIFNFHADNFPVHVSSMTYEHSTHILPLEGSNQFLYLS